MHTVPLGISMAKHRSQPFLEVVDLSARLPEPSQFDDGSAAESQTRAGRESVKIDSSGRDVVAELAGANLVASLGK
jgi:hypothetical protein